MHATPPPIVTSRARLLERLAAPALGAAIAEGRPVAAIDRSTGRLAFANAAFARLFDCADIAVLLLPDGPAGDAAAALARFAARFPEETPHAGHLRLPLPGGPRRVLATVDPVTVRREAPEADEHLLRFTLSIPADDDTRSGRPAIAAFLALACDGAAAAWVPPDDGEPVADAAAARLVDAGRAALAGTGSLAGDAGGHGGCAIWPVGGIGGVVATDAPLSSDPPVARTPPATDRARSDDAGAAHGDAPGADATVRPAGDAPAAADAPAPHALVDEIRRAFVAAHDGADDPPGVAAAPADDARDPGARDAGAGMEERAAEDGLDALETLSRPEREAFRAIAAALGATFEGDGAPRRAGRTARAPGTAPPRQPTAAPEPRAPEPDARGQDAPEPADEHAPPAPSAPPDARPRTAGESATRSPERELVDKIPLPLVVVRGARVLQANGPARALLGHPTAEAIEDAGGLSALFADPRPDAAAPEGTVALKSADGATIDVAARMLAIRYEGERALLLAIEPATTAGGTRAPDRPVAAHAADWVEGLRGGVAAIRAMADLLGRGAAARPAHESATLRAIAAEADALLERLGAIEAHAAASDPPGTADAPRTGEAGADATAILRTLVATRAGAAQRGDVLVSLAIADGLPPVAVGERRLSQTVAILLDRAIDRARGGRVWIDLSAAATDVLLTIRDDGPGMTEAELSRAFAPFAPPARTPPAPLPPVELDLALARAAAAAGHLALSATSSPRGGTTVELVLPARA